MARCLLEHQASGGDATSILSAKIVEELTFSVKVEDKPKLKQMQMDNLALALSLSKERSQMDQLIQKGLGLKNN